LKPFRLGGHRVSLDLMVRVGVMFDNVGSAVGEDFGVQPFLVSVSVGLFISAPLHATTAALEDIPKPPSTNCILKKSCSTLRSSARIWFLASAGQRIASASGVYIVQE
jgi:hypothetical protein